MRPAVNRAAMKVGALLFVLLLSGCSGIDAKIKGMFDGYLGYRDAEGNQPVIAICVYCFDNPADPEWSLVRDGVPTKHWQTYKEIHCVNRTP